MSDEAQNHDQALLALMADRNQKRNHLASVFGFETEPAQQQTEPPQHDDEEHHS